MPTVGVFPDKFNRGIQSITGPHTYRDKKTGTLETFEPILSTRKTLHEALTTRWETDAHMVCYALLESDGTESPYLPLCRKPVLPEFRAGGGDLVAVAIGLDWDTPNHVPLTPDALSGFLEAFYKAIDADPRLADWAAWYASRAGTRVFYELAAPVPVDDAERYIGSIVRAFSEQGLEFDRNCADWTRRFRLPQVLRDGQRTEEAELYVLERQERKLEVAQFGKGTRLLTRRLRTFARTDRSPSQEDCQALLYEAEEGGRRKPTRFLDFAKKALKQTSFYSRIFENEPLPTEGRNDYLLRLLGVVVPILIRRAYAKAEDVFALLYEPLCQWEAGPGQQDPHDHAWNAVQDIFGREIDAYNAEQKKSETELQQAEDTLDRMAKGMRMWCDSQELGSKDPDEVKQYVRHRLFACCGRYYYPMQEDGWYGHLCLLRDQLISRVRKCYMKDLIPTWKIGQGGVETSASVIDVANQYSTVVHQIKMSPLQKDEHGNRVGGHILSLDGEKPVLILPMYRRNDALEPTFNDEVDIWLRCLFGDHYDNAARWIGYALDFEAGPICALSIRGPGSTGKKMLIEGLSECLEEPEFATGEDLAGSFNGKFLYTPFLTVNEGWPKGNGRGISPGDQFKGLTAGDAVSVREMYRPRVDVLNPMRVILTANDKDLLYELTRGKELTPDSKEAIGNRIYHIDNDDAAALYLHSIGGRGHTGADGKRWIRGDSGQPSNFIVAKHLMWLYQHRPPRDLRQRLCVMGNCGSTSGHMFDMAAQSDSMPTVMRAVIGMVEHGQTSFREHLHMLPGRLYVTLYGVLRFIREIAEERIAERALESSMKSLETAEGSVTISNKTFRSIDVGMVLHYAERWGMDAVKLRAIADEKK